MALDHPTLPADILLIDVLVCAVASALATVLIEFAASAKSTCCDAAFDRLRSEESLREFRC